MGSIGIGMGSTGSIGIGICIGICIGSIGIGSIGARGCDFLTSLEQL